MFELVFSLLIVIIANFPPVSCLALAHLQARWEGGWWKVLETGGGAFPHINEKFLGRKMYPL